MHTIRYIAFDTISYHIASASNPPNNPLSLPISYLVLSIQNTNANPLLSTTLQFTIPPSRNRRIIRLQHTRLTLIRLTKRIPTLFAHTLHLAHFADCFLELLHSITHILASILKPPVPNRRRRTWVYNPECYISESPAHDDMLGGNTCVSHISTQSLLQDRAAGGR
jgi:hypothetical protein